LVWWQILLIIIGAIVAGTAVGIAISYFTRRLMQNYRSRRTWTGMFSSAATSSSTSVPISTPPPAPDQAAEPPGGIPVDDIPQFELNYTQPPAESPAIPRDLFTEIEANYRLAGNPSNETLTAFDTKTWDKDKEMLAKLPADVREDLSQAYVDMRLANSIVWLATDLGRQSDDLTQSYHKLCRNITNRLERVIDLLK
jgi:hypothetical protein